MSELAKGLHSLCARTKGQPEIQGKPSITEEQLRQGSLGLADYFVRSVVLVVAEEVCGNPRASHEFEVMKAPQAQGWTLRWVRNSSSYVNCAASIDREELEGLLRLHGTLQERMRAAPEAQKIVKAWYRVAEAEEAVNKKLEEIMHLARFQRVCSLYCPRRATGSQGPIGA